MDIWVYGINDNETIIKVIEGDVDGIVSYATYKKGDAVIMGYGRLPSDGSITLRFSRKISPCDISTANAPTYWN